MSARTLTRRRLEWGLRECDLPQINRTVAIDPPIRASLVSSHSKGLNIAEIHTRLEKETGFQLSIRTVKRYLKKLDLKQVINDVQDEKVTLHQVHEAIDHARNFLGYNNAGYRRMRTILVRQYSIRIPSSKKGLSHLDYAFKPTTSPGSICTRSTHSSAPATAPPVPATLLRLRAKARFACIGYFGSSSFHNGQEADIHPESESPAFSLCDFKANQPTIIGCIQFILGLALSPAAVQIILQPADVLNSQPVCASPLVLPKNHGRTATSFTASINWSNTPVRAVLDPPCSTNDWNGVSDRLGKPLSASINWPNTAVRASLKPPCSTGDRTGLEELQSDPAKPITGLT
ncbi:hypothetical protein PCASD_07961 [Puccinia coronata f. sp. avenae]|uniref:Uncharacterized protein n=1 Tax=Puccinia coronata f. sp. avenae TaxID=200324 RepID=A0A2N5UTI2_9BASI|nr:hypothetical protein PCASD_07961 [Puccinia coronata f. sp. avenae]